MLVESECKINAYIRCKTVLKIFIIKVIGKMNTVESIGIMKAKVKMDKSVVYYCI